MTHRGYFFWEGGVGVGPFLIITSFVTLRGEVLTHKSSLTHNFYWSACTKLGKWAVIYIYLSPPLLFLRLSYWISEMFRSPPLFLRLSYWISELFRSPPSFYDCFTGFRNCSEVPPLSTTVLLYFGTVPKAWYFFVFLFYFFLQNRCLQFSHYINRKSNVMS
jgi:hypothetical protein